MDLFKYNPTPYVNTQVDLPLDFLQGQLETKQKEFDSQSAAVDKAAENFMKINPGMLTKDAYDRVKKQYLPEIEKIRDTLHQTGNISMAAPALSKFTMNLAADPQVKNIMEDYKLTEAYNKNLQEGKYTDKVFAGLFDAEGKQRAQLGEDQMTSASYYSPMQYTDPVSSLLPEAEKFKANIIEDITSKPNKYGLMQTDSVTTENLANERVRQWANNMLPTWKQNPENQAYFWNATGFKPETYTNEMWDKGVAQNIADLLSYKKVTKDTNFTAIPDQTVRAPSPNQNKTKTAAEETATKTGAPVSRQVINAKVGGFAAFEQDKYANNIISSIDELENDNAFTKTEMQKNYLALSKLSNGVIPATMDMIGQGSGANRASVRNWINDNYTKNEYNEWVLKTKTDKDGNVIPNNSPPITPEISASLNGFTEANANNNGKEKLIATIKEDTGVKNYDKSKIEVARHEVLAKGLLQSEEGYNFEVMTDGAQELYSKKDNAIVEYVRKMNPDASPEVIERKINLMRLQSVDQILPTIEKAAKLPRVLSNIMRGSKNVDLYGVTAFNELKNALGADKNNSDGQALAEITEFTTGLNSKVNEDMVKKLQGTAEGTIFKAFENIKNKMGAYQLSNLPGDGKFPEYEKQLINLALAGQLSGLTNIIKGTDAATENGLKEFGKAVPYIDGDATKGIDTNQISLSMGYNPSKGVVGVITMGGTFHEFDLDKANLDQQFTNEYPQLTQELRIYRDISSSVKRSSNTKGSFNIGNTEFVFDVKMKNLGKTKPDFSYEFSADGTNKQRYTDVGQIIAIASDIASSKLNEQDQIAQIMQQSIADKATIAISRARTLEEVNEIKQQAAIDMANAPTIVAKTYNQNNKPIGKVGKQGQFRQTPKTPLQ